MSGRTFWVRPPPPPRRDVVAARRLVPPVVRFVVRLAFRRAVVGRELRDRLVVLFRVAPLFVLVLTAMAHLRTLKHAHNPRQIH
jgi:hypothetical protein